MLQKFDKLHIEMLDCPKLLATKVMKSFPKLSIQTDTLRIIKLSYHNYQDQNKGKIDVSSDFLSFSKFVFSIEFILN